MNVKHTYMRRKVKSQPKLFPFGFFLKHAVVQVMEHLLAKLLHHFQNFSILDMQGWFNMFLRTDQNMGLRSSFIEVVEGKAILILGDDQIIILFFVEDLAELAILFARNH